MTAKTELDYVLIFFSTYHSILVNFHPNLGRAVINGGVSIVQVPGLHRRCSCAWGCGLYGSPPLQHLPPRLHWQVALRHHGWVHVSHGCSLKADYSFRYWKWKVLLRFNLICFDPLFFLRFWVPCSDGSIWGSLQAGYGGESCGLSYAELGSGDRY